MLQRGIPLLVRLSSVARMSHRWAPVRQSHAFHTFQRLSFSTTMVEPAVTTLATLTSRVRDIGSSLSATPEVIDKAVEMLEQSPNVHNVTIRTAPSTEELVAGRYGRHRITEPYVLLSIALSAEEFSTIFPLSPESVPVVSAPIAASDPLTQFLASVRALRAVKFDILDPHINNEKAARARRRVLFSGNPSFGANLIHELRTICNVHEHKLGWVFKHVAFYISPEDHVRRAVLERVVQELKDLEFDQVGIGRLIQRTPSIFAYRPGRLRQQFDFLVNRVGMTADRARAMMCNQPWSMAVKESHYTVSKQFLLSQGFSQEDCDHLCKRLIVLRADPASKLGPIVKWALGEGYSTSYIARHSYVFTYSLKQRTIPRAHIWHRTIGSEQYMPLTHLTKPDASFAKMAGITLDEYKQVVAQVQQNADAS